jgi:hypothetical protein
LLDCGRSTSLPESHCPRPSSSLHYVRREDAVRRPRNATEEDQVDQRLLDPSLVEVSLPQLTRAGDVHIHYNEQLDGEALGARLAGVSAIELRVAPDQTQLVLDPCPWTTDPSATKTGCARRGRIRSVRASEPLASADADLGSSREQPINRWTLPLPPAGHGITGLTG